MFALILLLVVPIASIVLSHLILNYLNSDFASQSLPAVTEICSPNGPWASLIQADSSLRSACEEIGWIDFMQTAGWSLTLITLVVFGCVWVAAKLAGNNRKINASLFPKLVPLMLIFIGISVVAQGALATFALYEAQAQFLGSWFPLLTGGVGLGAIIVALVIISASAKISTRTEMTQRAVVLDDKDLPLWSFVEEIADSIGAPAPTNIVVGLEPNFYATSADVKALSSEKTVKGETLYISAPLMRLLSIDEIRAVIGHELGHFKGKDAEFAKKFAPVYRALGEAMNGAGNQQTLMALPAMGALSFLHKAFETNEKQISRDREFEADRIGAQASTASALIHALVKLNVFGGLWPQLQVNVIKNLNLGRPVENMSSLYGSSVAFDTDDLSARNKARDSLASRTSHPTDTHPTLSERANNLNVEESIVEFTELSIPSDPASKLLPDLSDLEKQLTTDEQRFYVALGVASWESEKPEGENVYQLTQLLETAAAVMVCADGKIEISEIERAEVLGVQMVQHFNSLSFREKCLKFEELPSVDELSDFLGNIDSEEFKELVVTFLTSIAESDGEISLDEQKFIYGIVNT